MKANELRIGNWVEYNGYIYQIAELRSKLIQEDSVYLVSKEREAWTEYDKLKPIPLTEEWLFKFGFIQIHENNFQDFECEIMVDLFNEKIHIISAMPWKQLNHIKYVHQLHNLYFALTNEELTFKSE